MQMTAHLSQQSNTANEVAEAARLIHEISACRPMANPLLEQFHMTPESLLLQSSEVTSAMAGKTVLLVGDDDHLSIPLARFGLGRVVVIEVDPRVVHSLRNWTRRLRLSNLTVIEGDVRTVHRPSTQSLGCESFYLNPPFSSKNGGHGVRAWISTGLHLAQPRCEGIVVMPAKELALPWVHRLWGTFLAYLEDNGIVVSRISGLRCEYFGTKTEDLRSCNVYVQRTNPAKRRLEIPRSGSRLYR